METNLAGLERDVEAARSRIISEGSRNSYRSSSVRFLQWMMRRKRDLVRDEFVWPLVLDAARCPTKASLKASLGSAPSNPPLYFEQVTTRDFLT